MRKRNEGFTLLELLLAAALMSVMLVGVLSITGRLVSGWKYASRKLTYDHDAYRILDKLEKTLERGALDEAQCQALLAQWGTEERVELIMQSYQKGFVDVCLHFPERSETEYKRRILFVSQRAQ
tara:strand:- start:81273 stop:81644 length:372 start_codon:yes stop_codon:yes gene_type:complete